MEAARGQDSSEVDLGDVTSRLAVKWKLLLVVTLVAAAAAYGASRLLPKTYESKATIYVQQNNLVARLISDVPLPIASGRSGTSGYLVALLESDTMFTSVIAAVDLTSQPEYRGVGAGDSSAAIEMLRRKTYIGEDKSGSVAVVAKARKPQLAANIANAFLDHLGKLVTTGSMRKASFISENLEDVGEKLEGAEEKLLKFQEANDVNIIGEETASMISKLAELDGRSVALEMELLEIDSELANSGELGALVDLEVRKKALTQSKEFLDRQIDDIQRSMSALPAVTLRYARLQRNISVLSKTFELLTEQYQLATISKYGEDGDYQVIDRARPVDEPVSPRVMLNTAIGGMLGFFASAFLIAWVGRPTYGKAKYVPKPHSAVRQR